MGLAAYELVVDEILHFDTTPNAQCAYISMLEEFDHRAAKGPPYPWEGF
jgi:hypothetical protein